jgi:hypothetical protein
MHIHANELTDQLYNAYLDGVWVDDVIEAEDGPRGFLILDLSGWPSERDESDPGPAFVLFGNVTLEPIP